MQTRVERLKYAIGELKQIDLKVLFPGAGRSEEDRAEEDRLQFELKGIVDELRSSIWCSFKAPTKSGEDAQKMVEFYRMRRVVQMLREIRSDKAKDDKSPTVLSGLQQIEATAENAVQSHYLSSRIVN